MALSFGALSLPAIANGCLGFEETGTIVDPKLVASESDLALLGASNCLSSSYYFQQTTDISLIGSWAPYSLDFTANCDGSGHAIKLLGA